MPSPFPGMDPWLEHHALWPDVHRNLISVCQEILTPLVAPNYYVRGEERVYIAGSPMFIEPDVLVVTREAQPKYNVASPRASQTRPTPSAPVVFPLTLLEDEIRERYLEILERGTGQVVTVIEILSPANKIKGTARHQQFVRKRTEILNSDTHWIEIDLLRAGTRWELAPGPSDYCVILSRVDGRQAKNPTAEAWLLNLPDCLPTVSVPLRAPHPDVGLDLQHALNTIYDRAGYALSVDYTQPPEPPLPPEMLAWARDAIGSK